MKNNKKKLGLILSLILVQMAFSQVENGFGIIVDKDGYANMRQKPNTKSAIKGKIKSGEVVGIGQATMGEKIIPNWLWVDVHSPSESPVYIHQSRVKRLETLPQIPFQKKQGNTLVFGNKKNVEISVSVKTLSFEKDIKPHISGKYGEFYKGKFAYGFDGTTNLDKDFMVEVFDKIIVNLGGKNIEIPQRELENLFLVRDFIEAYHCYWDKERNRIFIQTAVGDGAGSRDLLFIIENNKFKEKKIFVSF